MVPDDPSGARPAGPVVLRIKLRYDDLDTMVLKFASNVGKSGLFLPTKSIQPIGTEVKFELRLSNDTPVLVGLGRVKHVRPPDPANPKAAFGMAIELMRVSREGREVIIKMIERRRALGLPEVAIPFPEDVEASRRSEVETQPRVDTSGIVRDAMRDFASAPVAEQVLRTPVSAPLAAPKPAPAPPAPLLRESAPAVVRESASLLTSPRQGSGPIPTAATDAASGRRSVPALAPEAPKPKRPRAADLLAKANDLADRLSTAAVPGLDAQVDVERALVRARALAGNDLDRELAALGETAAAPLEISIEAASAELARQLGGKAITKRERSVKAESVVSVRAQSSAVAITPPPEAESFVTKTRAPTEASPAAVIAAVTTPVEPPPAPVEIARAEAALPAQIDPASGESLTVAPIEPASVETLTAAPIVPADEPADDPAAEYAVDDKTRIPSGEDYENAFLPSTSTTTGIDPEDELEVPVERAPSFASISEDQLRTQPGEDLRRMLIDDAADEGMLRRALEGSSPAMKLDDSDLEEVAEEEDHGESTHIGALPIGFPHAPEDLSARLDRELAEADAEADAEFREMASSEARVAPYAIQPAAYPESYEEAAAEGSEEISDLDVLAEADAGDADLLHAHAEREAIGEPADAAQYGEQAYAEPAYPDPQEAVQYAEPQAYAEQPAEPQAYAEPSDELPHYSDPNEAAAPVFPDEMPGYMEPVRPSQEDFAARLDLDDEPDDEEERRNFPTANPRPRSRAESYSRPPSASEFHDPPSESYTFAEPFPQIANLGFAPHPAPAGEDFDEPHGFTQNTPVPASRGPSSRAPEFEQPARARSASRMPQPAPDPDDQIGRALQSLDEPSQPQGSQQPPTEDLEDALAALDVDLDPQVQEQRRVRRQTGSQRPLPGLPLQRETGPSPVAPPPRTRTTGANVIQRNPAGHKPPTMPPPIPVRRSGTTPPPMPVAAPPQRAPTDDGIMIDFDDDE